MNRDFFTGVTLLLVLFAGMLAFDRPENASGPTTVEMAPRFEVDLLWPMPLPNHWSLGQTIGVSADAQDNIRIIHRQDSLEASEVHAATNPPITQCWGLLGVLWDTQKL